MGEFMQKENRAIKWNLVFTLVVLVATGIFIWVTMSAAMKETEVRIDGQGVSIGGQYAAVIDPETITSVYLLDKLPENLRRTNGFEAGNVLRGHFTVNGVPTMLYLFSKDPPCLYIDTTDNHYVINYRDAQKTKDLYRAVLSVWKK